MHIALFTDLHPATLGGAQTSINTQRRVLEQLGHRVTVFSPPLGKTADRDPCLVELKPVPVMARLMQILGRYDDFVLVWPSRVNRELIDKAFLVGEPIDVVHAQGDLGVAIAGIEAGRRHGIPVVQTKHTRYDAYLDQATPAPLLLAKIVSRMQKPDLARAFTFVPAEGESLAARMAWRFMIANAQATDHEIVPTRHFARSLVEQGMNCPISVISNGIDDAAIDRAMAADVARPSDGEPLRLIWCGRLSAEKRVLAAVDAVAQVEDCTLDIYGEGMLGGTLRKIIESAGLSERVRLRGRVGHEECLTAMRSSGALLFTSYGFDTQGLVLLEAAAMSLPAIYCDPALSETVPDGGGLLSAGPSPAALAAAIRLVIEDRDRLRAMSAVVAGYQEIPRQSVQTEKIMAVYRSLVDRIPA